MTITPLSSPGVPVPMTPRAASSGSSPKPTRHLMAGTFRSYLTIDVNGGAIRLPTVLYSLITGRSYGGRPSGYGGSTPRPLAAGASGRIDTEPAPAISSGGAPDPRRAPRRATGPVRVHLALSSTAPPARRHRQRSNAETTASVPSRRRSPFGSRPRRSVACPRRCRSPGPLSRRRAPARRPIPGDRHHGSSGSSPDTRLAPATAAARRVRSSRLVATGAGCPGCRG